MDSFSQNYILSIIIYLYTHAYGKVCHSKGKLYCSSLFGAAPNIFFGEGTFRLFLQAEVQAATPSSTASAFSQRCNGLKTLFRQLPLICDGCFGDDAVAVTERGGFAKKIDVIW